MVSHNLILKSLGAVFKSSSWRVSLGVPGAAVSRPRRRTQGPPPSRSRSVRPRGLRTCLSQGTWHSAQGWGEVGCLGGVARVGRVSIGRRAWKKKQDIS